MMRGHRVFEELRHRTRTDVEISLETRAQWERRGIGAHQRTKKKPSERGNRVDHRKTANICVRRCLGTTKGANLCKRAPSSGSQR